MLRQLDRVTPDNLTRLNRAAIRDPAPIRSLFERLKEAVKPGGAIHVSLATVEDPAYQRHRAAAGAVEDDSFLVEKMGCRLYGFQPNELRSCFPDFDILSYSERDVHDTHGNERG